MLNKIAFLLLISVASGNLVMPVARAQTGQENADAFHRGIEFYQAKDYAKAKDSFLESLANNPDSIALNANLGMTYFNLGDKPRALAHLRKAQTLDPSASTPREALAYLRSQGVATNVESADGLRAFYEGMLKFAAWIPAVVLFILTPLALLAFGWTLIQYLVRRRDADEGVSVSLPKTTIFAGIFWLVLLSFQILQTLHENGVRGTVIVEKTSVLSAPEEKAPSLFEAAGGEDLEIIAVSGDWSQIANVRGEYGWARSVDLLITSRRQSP